MSLLGVKKVSMEDEQGILEALGDDGLREWWQRNRDPLEDAAREAIRVFGSGESGDEKDPESDKLSRAIDYTYGVEIVRPVHYGGWADQSEYLAAYPRAEPVFEKLIKRKIDVHGASMKDRFVYRLTVDETLKGAYLIHLDIANKAFYASFLESRGYSVTKHIGKEWEHIARGYGAEV